MHGDVPSIVPRRNYDIRTQCLKGTCSSSELPGRWHVSLFLDAACPCRGCSSMFSPEASTWKGRLRVPLLDRIHCLGFPDRADDGVRTRGLLLGKQACCHCTTSASRGTGSGPMTLGLWGRSVDGPAGPAVSRAAGGRPLSAYSIAGARRLDMTSFLGMSALTRGGMPHVVEPAGFEPATFPLRTGRPATGRRPRSAPDRIRTCNLWFRRPTL